MVLFSPLADVAYICVCWLCFAEPEDDLMMRVMRMSCSELKSDERHEFESIDGQPSVFEVERIWSCLILTDVHPRERPGR